MLLQEHLLVPLPAPLVLLAGGLQAAPGLGGEEEKENGKGHLLISKPLEITPIF